MAKIRFLGERGCSILGLCLLKTSNRTLVWKLGGVRLWGTSIMKLKLALAAAAVVGLSAMSAQAAPTYPVYYDSSTLTGNQSWTYDLGQDFTVNHATDITSLGAFTNGGLNTGVEVALYLLNDANPSDGGTLIASTVVGSSAFVIGDYAFENITRTTLAPGFYQLQSYGTGSNTNYNTYGGSTAGLAFNTLNGAYTQGADYYSAGGIGIATTPDSHFYGAASIGAAPEPGVWALMIAGLAMMGGALRFRRRQAGAVAAA